MGLRERFGKIRPVSAIMKSLLLALLLVIAAVAVAARAAHLQPKDHQAAHQLSKFIRNGTRLNDIWSDCSKSISLAIITDSSYTSTLSTFFCFQAVLVILSRS